MYIDANKKILKHLGNKYGHPVTIKIGPTDKCNFNCSYCSEDKTAGREMDDLIGLMDIIAPHCLSIVFSGNGEPTMHPDFVKAVERAVELDLQVGLITNSIPLSEEKIDKLKNLCTWIRVSVDATNSEDYNRAHGVSPKLFGKVLENLRRMSGGKATIGAGFLMREGLDIAKASKFPADYIQFRNLHGDTTDYTDKIGGLGLYKKGSTRSLPKTCHAGDFTKVIEPNGDVVWCCHHRGDPLFILGNVFVDPTCLNKSMKVDTSKCPLTCMHRNMNEFLDVDTPHGDFI